MKKTLAILVLSVASSTHASTCQPNDFQHHPETAMTCYLQTPEPKANGWVLDGQQHDSRGVTVERYTLATQEWPKATMSAYARVWQQRLVIYRPDVIHSQQALLFVNGGTRNPNFSRGYARAMEVDFAYIAAATQSVVVDLQDIPNQYLTLDDGVERREDSMVAYTWKRYLEHPAQSAYWPLQLPMTKAVIKAMDATQAIIQQESHVQLKQFAISGASKRGWVTWLTALHDDRVNAIMPIVIDILNMKPNLQHIYASYDHHWPMAFGDYTRQHIPDAMNTPEFTQLTELLDPIAYLHARNHAHYQQRLSIPKYIISASGDDFFVPDASTLYVDQLPGETILRVTPNQSHFISSKIVSEALLSYYATLVFHVKRPHATWQINSAGTLQSATVNATPTQVLLWEAVNATARDFRLAALVQYHSTPLNGRCEKNQCTYPVNITPPTRGWKADFIEATYTGADGQQFVVTTPVYISGKKVY